MPLERQRILPHVESAYWLQYQFFDLDLSALFIDTIVQGMKNFPSTSFLLILMF
ncbi:MAG: hypothetical protein Ct9H300mP4_00600 [Gammaproteobacteria bacterium]|nr:MAG: hypothetical protein Ct9H300mP4_00600 [Gammaproteobacteria bacterium]